MKKDPPAWRGSYPHLACKPTLPVLWTPLASASPLQLRVEQGRPPWGERPRAACTALSERVPMGTHSRWGAPHARLWVWSPQGWWRCGRREALTSSVNGLRACRCPQAGLPGGCSYTRPLRGVGGWVGGVEGRKVLCGGAGVSRPVAMECRCVEQTGAGEVTGSPGLRRERARPQSPVGLWLCPGGPREGPIQGAGSAWWTC